MADYYLDVYDDSGTRQFVITDYTSLSYTRKVNAPGLLQVGLRGDHPLLAQLADKWQIEVWRKPAGGVFARDFVGLARQEEYSYGEKGEVVLTLPGLMSMLSWRVVAYPANTYYRSQFLGVETETIAKTLVTYNATSSATTGDGRIRNGAIAGMSVEADGGNGEALDWYCAKDNLLETLQNLAAIGGGDYDLVKTAATTWQFRWYDGQLGTDRTATVIFALERGNMGRPQYKHLRMDEKTVAIVGGQGEDENREIATVTGPNYASDNDIEMFVDAPDVETADGLTARGSAALEEARAKQSFQFDVLQTPASLYGAHYFLGDLVTAVNPFTFADTSVKIDSAAISVEGNGADKIDIQMVVV